ncbi:hypothetical protein NVP1088O_24 [Vibrio phage 1.088.O._10N.261.46.A1]|nr:hypothetical protein NVP1088O_24 [Vibrio phage 1.088.O._10N.261.46.A1]
MKRLTTDEFILRARKVHGNTYDYSDSTYTTSHTKIEIICPTHGKFYQTPTCHLSGGRCLECSKISRALKRRRSPSSFITRALEVHGNRYDYSKTEYRVKEDKVTITCPDHGNFYQHAGSHLRGVGCPRCVNNVQLTVDEFISKALSVHSGKYTYPHRDYVNHKTKVTVLCETHGHFRQNANSHLSGRGCPDCAEFGFNPDKDSYLYFLLSDTRYLKVGISNHPKERISRLVRHTPFDFRTISVLKTPQGQARNLERFCHESIASANLAGFDGCTEWLAPADGQVDVLYEIMMTFGCTRCTM